MISGTEDQHTTPAQTRALFATAPDPKRLWLVPGAAHVDLERFAGVEYERRVLQFLADAFRAGKASIARPQAPSA